MYKLGFLFGFPFCCSLLLCLGKDNKAENGFCLRLTRESTLSMENLNNSPDNGSRPTEHHPSQRFDRIKSRVRLNKSTWVSKLSMAMWLFVGEPVWTPYNRPHDHLPARKGYLETFVEKQGGVTLLMLQLEFYLLSLNKI
ncbi:hypothetical protein ACFE04_019521 [Oxalis oulophora]